MTTAVEQIQRDLNQMGKEGERALRETPQEKKRADKLPDVSDHGENTREDFSILLERMKRRGDSKLQIKQRKGNSSSEGVGETVD